MHLNTDISTALQQMETIKKVIEDSDDIKLQANTNDNLKIILNILQDPVFRSIIQMQDALSELNTQILQHPSILPRDFDISTSGDLILNVPPPTLDIYDNEYPDEQRVPSAQLSPRSPNSPPLSNIQSCYQNSSIASSSNNDNNDNILLMMDDHQLNLLKKSRYSDLGGNISGGSGGGIIINNTRIDEDRPHSAISDSSKHTINDIFLSEWTQIQALELVNDGSGLGFGIIGARTSGVIVKTILTGGVADRDGRLMSGDHILQIGDVNLHDMVSEQVASVLRQSGTHVRLVVARPIDPINATEEIEGTAIVPARLLTDPNELERYLIAAGYPDIFGMSSTSSTPTPTTANDRFKFHDIDTIGSDGGCVGQRPPISPPSDLDLPETERFNVELIKDSNGLGITIAGYVCEKEELSGIFVKSVSAGSAADLSGRIQVNDRIIEVDRQSLHGFSNHQAVEVLKRSGTIVNLCIERYLRGPKFDQLQQAIAANELKPSSSSTQSSGNLLQGPGRPHSVMSMGSHQSINIEQSIRRSSLNATAMISPQENDSVDGLQNQLINEKSTGGVQSVTTATTMAKSSSGTVGDNTTINNPTRKLVHARDSIENKLVKDERNTYHKTSNTAFDDNNNNNNTNIDNNYIDDNDDDDDDVDINNIENNNKFLNKINKNVVQATNLSTVNKNKYWVEPELTADIENAIKKRWRSVLGSDTKIIVAQIRKFAESSGLGISLEGTVDVEGGREVRPHHYIRSILPEGPVGQNGLLSSGDELLEVNGQRLLGMNHLEVVSILKELPQDVRMVCGRGDIEMIPFTEENVRKNLGIGFGGSQNLENLLPTDRLVKAKSDGSLATISGGNGCGNNGLCGTNGNINDDSGFIKLKSRSLEPLTGLAMWSSEPQIIELIKGERGLGFSILDYQDPLDANDTLIVIRSLVPGGVAQLDGRLIPGDRLLFVNDMNLENSSLDQAVQALKGAPKGIVRIGVAKPLPMADTSLNLSQQSHPQQHQHQQHQQQHQHSEHNIRTSFGGGSGMTTKLTSATMTTSLTGGETTEPDIIPEWKSK